MLFRACSEIRNPEATELNLRRCLFAAPIGLVMLTTAIADRRRLGAPDLSYLPPDDPDVASFFAEVGFVDYVESGEVLVGPPSLRIRHLSLIEP